MQSDNGDCDCAELLVAGRRVPPPLMHCCDYVRQRNALIAQAEAIADQCVAVVPPGRGNDAAVTESRTLWTRAFSTAMDELAKPLLNGAGQRSAASPG